MYAKKLFPNKVTFIVFWGGKRAEGILFNPVDPLSMPCGNTSQLTTHFGIITMNGFTFLLLTLSSNFTFPLKSWSFFHAMPPMISITVLEGKEWGSLTVY